ARARGDSRSSAQALSAGLRGRTDVRSAAGVAIPSGEQRLENSCGSGSAMKTGKARSPRCIDVGIATDKARSLPRASRARVQARLKKGLRQASKKAAKPLDIGVMSELWWPIVESSPTFACDSAFRGLPMASSEARKNPPPVPKKRFHARQPTPPGAAEARAALDQGGARRRSDQARQAARLQAAVSDRPPPQDPGVHAASVPPPPPSAVSAVAGSIAPATLKATAVDARAEEAKRRRLGLVAAAALLLAVSGTVAVLDTGLQPGAPAASRAARVVAPP